MLKTRFTELVGCTVPIQEAPIKDWPRLALAVTQAGGLGMVRVNGWTPKRIASTFDDMRKQTSGVFGAGFLNVTEPKLIEEEVAAAAAPTADARRPYRRERRCHLDAATAGGVAVS